MKNTTIERKIVNLEEEGLKLKKNSLMVNKEEEDNFTDAYHNIRYSNVSVTSITQALLKGLNDNTNNQRKMDMIREYLEMRHGDALLEALVQFINEIEKLIIDANESVKNFIHFLSNSTHRTIMFSQALLQANVDSKIVLIDIFNEIKEFFKSGKEIDNYSIAKIEYFENIIINNEIINQDEFINNRLNETEHWKHLKKDAYGKYYF
jgi:hypothetical protein